MNFKTLNHFSTTQVKALFGFHPTILARMLCVILPELERQRTARLTSHEDRKQPLIADDGRSRTVTPLHTMLMALLYLSHNVNHVVIRSLFGFSPTLRRMPSTK